MNESAVAIFYLLLDLGEASNSPCIPETEGGTKGLVYAAPPPGGPYLTQ